MSSATKEKKTTTIIKKDKDNKAAPSDKETIAEEDLNNTE